ncbi:unnamed protein product [Withania somnifera]
MLFGIKWCINNGHNMIIGETDSLPITKCIRREWKLPRRILNIISEIQELVEEHGLEINHCFREANKTADKLANLSHSYESIHVFNSYAGLPNQVKGLVNMNLWGIHSIIYDPP